MKRWLELYADEQGYLYIESEHSNVHGRCIGTNPLVSFDAAFSEHLSSGKVHLEGLRMVTQ